MHPGASAFVRVHGCLLYTCQRGELSSSVMHLWLVARGGRANSLSEANSMLKVSNATCLSLPTTQWASLRANQLAQLALHLTTTAH